jgi:transposase
MASERRYSAALKAQMVVDVLSGRKTVSSACRQHQVSEQSFYEWQAEFMAHSARVFSKEEELAATAVRIAELERLVGRLVLQWELEGPRAQGAKKGGDG